jgi:putative hydrolase of the HAD superfamily
VNVVFDLGGVLVAYDRAALVTRLYPDPVEQAAVRRELIDHEDWIALDRGTLSEAAAVARVAERAGLPATRIARLIDEVASAWRPVPGMDPLLRRLHANGHTLFCLSNMHPASAAFLERSFSFWDVFAGVVISCRVGLCKPEPAIYAHLLERFGLKAAETVFVDDLAENVAAAAAFGIHPVRFESPEQCARALETLGCRT